MASKLKINLEQQRKAEQDRMDMLKKGTDRIRAIVQKTPEVIRAELVSEYPDHILDDGPMPRPLKTRNEDNIRVALALHLFTKYPVPARIQTVWYSPSMVNDRARLRAMPAPRRFMDERKKCFFVVGSGGSPYKEVYKEFLSKKEVHRFLYCRYDLDYYKSIIYAIARTFVDDDAIALRLAHSKIVDQDYHDPFWRDVIRFFAANSTTKEKLNDLIDYIANAKHTDTSFSLKGRTLTSLSNLMEVWHRELRLIKKIGHHKWDGLALPDWGYIKDKDYWSISQILDGKKLAKEGAEMHHCVYSYRYQCAKGRIGIFSLVVKREHSKEEKRALTIEVTEDAVVVQVRGFANRVANAEENFILKKWCGENNLRMV